MAGSDLPTYAAGLRTLEEQKRGEKWARTALEAEAGLVARTMTGQRNALLNDAALKLGRKVAAGYLSEGDVIGALRDAAHANGYTQEHGLEATMATIRSGLTAGLADPQHPQDRQDYQRQQGMRVVTNAPAASERRSKFFRASELHGKPVPPREWLVPDLIPHRTVTLFSGDGGTGKSLLALQLAVAAATERRWIGREVTAGSVLYLSAEDDTDELHRRLSDILASEHADFRDLDRLTIRGLAGEDALLAVETAVNLATTTLYQELEAAAAAQRDVRVIVLDTLADLYPANENDRAKVRQFVGLLRGLAIRQSCAVVLLSHPSLSGLTSGAGTSGSTAWNNSVRSRLYLERITDGPHEPDANRRRLRTMKANYGQVGGEIGLTWQRGVFVPDEPAAGLDRMAAGAKAERVFLKLLDEWSAQGRHVSASPGVSYAPTVFAGLPKAEGMTKHALRGAMEALFSRGELTLAEHGRGVNARKHIERASGGSHAD